MDQRKKISLPYNRDQGYGTGTPKSETPKTEAPQTGIPKSNHPDL